MRCARRAAICARFPRAWFYSDSHNDLPLLEQVTNPVAVDPDDILRRTALERGWQLRSASNDGHAPATGPLRAAGPAMNRSRLVAWIIVLAVPAACWSRSGTAASTYRPAGWSPRCRGQERTSTARSCVGLRAPRALAALPAALLALAGTLLQALLRNPLADPFPLGVSGGAAAGALLAMLTGAALVIQHLFALAGAAFAAATVLGFSLRPSGWNAHRVILAGVAMSSDSARW